jgi:hypothetical protein
LKIQDWRFKIGDSGLEIANNDREGRLARRQAQQKLLAICRSTTLRQKVRTRRPDGYCQSDAEMSVPHCATESHPLCPFVSVIILDSRRLILACFSLPMSHFPVILSAAKNLSLKRPITTRFSVPQGGTTAALRMTAGMPDGNVTLAS